MQLITGLVVGAGAASKAVLARIDTPAAVSALPQAKGVSVGPSLSTGNTVHLSPAEVELAQIFYPHLDRHSAIIRYATDKAYALQGGRFS